MPSVALVHYNYIATCINYSAQVALKAKLETEAERNSPERILVGEYAALFTQVFHFTYTASLILYWRLVQIQRQE